VAALLALVPLGAAQAAIEILIPDASEQIQNNVRAFLSLTRYAERDDITPRCRACNDASSPRPRTRSSPWVTTSPE
jgi:hypothetical protein